MAKRLQGLLPLIPDDVDLSIIGDRLEGDMWHSLVDEPVTYIAMHRLRADLALGDHRLFLLTITRIR